MAIRILLPKTSNFSEAQWSEGRRLKLGDTHPHTLESWNNLIELYEASNKPEKVKEWRAKLPQAEAKEE